MLTNTSAVSIVRYSKEAENISKMAFEFFLLLMVYVIITSNV